jgi:hypothetical protein
MRACHARDTDSNSVLGVPNFLAGYSNTRTHRNLHPAHISPVSEIFL